MNAVHTPSVADQNGMPVRERLLASMQVTERQLELAF